MRCACCALKKQTKTLTQTDMTLLKNTNPKTVHLFFGLLLRLVALGCFVLLVVVLCLYRAPGKGPGVRTAKGVREQGTHFNRVRTTP